MIKRLFLFPLLAVLLVVACAPTVSEQPASEQETGPVVTVYRAPT